MRSVLTKMLLVTTIVVVLGFAFARTLRNVGSAPYVVNRTALGAWTLEIGEPRGPEAPVVRLRPPRGLTPALFDQVFQRTMESYTTPAQPGIPLALYREVAGAVDGPASPDVLLALARRVGFPSAPLTPRCMAVHRTQRGREQRAFFVLFDAPAFDRFRDELAGILAASETPAQFRPDALAPALLVATSDPRRLDDVIPRALLDSACEAPVEVAPADG